MSCENADGLLLVSISETWNLGLPTAGPALEFQPDMSWKPAQGRLYVPWTSVVVVEPHN